MGSNAYATVGWGILVETSELPWYDENNGETDLEEWWLRESGFVEEPTPFDEYGEWKDGIEDKDAADAYFARKSSHLELHPLPFADVVSGSYDWCEEWLICAPDSVQSVSWGDAEPLRPTANYEPSAAWNAHLARYFPGYFARWYLAANHG